MIGLPAAVVADMLAHARAEAPLEACGLLVGKGDRVVRSHRLTNADHSAEHYSLDPHEHLAVVIEARGQGLQVLAAYHSHPATPARMSEEDLRLAITPGLRYVILSLADPAGPVIKGFTVEDGQATAEEVVVEKEEE